MKQYLLAIALICLTAVAPAAANEAAPPQLEALRQALAAGVKARDLTSIAAISCTGNLYYFGEFGGNGRFAAYINADE